MDVSYCDDDIQDEVVVVTGCMSFVGKAFL